MKKKSVAILGANGLVGQKAIALLHKSQYFEIKELVASEKRIGSYYKDICLWKEELLNLPDEISSIKMSDVNTLKSEFIISCIPSDAAMSIEPMLAKQGKIVFSNASAFRMHTDVPLIVPEINKEHLSVINKQKTPGKIITNPNCSTVGVTLGLAPLLDIGIINHVSVVTMQSLSGAGYPGIPAMDILGNTIPHIESEAEKITEETKKILSSTNNHNQFYVTSHVHRVPVLYGHSITLHVDFQNDIKIEEAVESYKKWNNIHKNLFVLHSSKDRPQVSRDLLHDDMRAHIGNLRKGDRSNILGLVILTNNLVRGAAGAAIRNMETYIDYSN